MEKLPTVDDAMDASDPDMVVEHDGVHDHQTCASCGRSWGAGMDDYSGMTVEWSDEAAQGLVCPDPDCGGVMGVVASAHSAWKEVARG